MMPQAQAGLLARDAVTNARALLRYALPVDEQKAKPIRQIQARVLEHRLGKDKGPQHTSMLHAVLVSEHTHP